MSARLELARERIRGLYPLLDDGVLRPEVFPRHAAALAAAGVAVMQLRMKRLTDRERLAVIRDVLGALSDWRGLLVIDDRADLAAIAAREVAPAGPSIGLHLGQGDLPPAVARAIVGPDVVIGWSTHDLSQVAASAALPVDYLGFGPVFPTATKANPDPVVGLAGLAAACRATSLPVVAIGGLSSSTLTAVAAHGAASAAVVGMLWPGDAPHRDAADTHALEALSGRVRAAMEAFG